MPCQKYGACSKAMAFTNIVRRLCHTINAWQHYIGVNANIDPEAQEKWKILMRKHISNHKLWLLNRDFVDKDSEEPGVQ